MAITVSERVVVEVGNVQWIVPCDRVTTVDGAKFITLSYSGDRGFAKFCGADMKQSNPLKLHDGLALMLKLRDDAMQQLLQPVAAEKLVCHTHGDLTLKEKAMLQDDIASVVEIEVPALVLGDESIDAFRLRVLSAIDPRKPIAIEATPLNLSYVRLAMRASVASSGAIKRSRPKHAERLCAQSGINGVMKLGANRVRVTATNPDGRVLYKTKKLAPEELEDPEVTARLCQRLKADVSTQPQACVPAPDKDIDEPSLRPHEHAAASNDASDCAYDGDFPADTHQSD